jgi:hypothetical protein
MKDLNEWWCDERLKDKVEESTHLRLTYTGLFGKPKAKDEVKRREVCECDG